MLRDTIYIHEIPEPSGMGTFDEEQLYEGEETISEDSFDTGIIDEIESLHGPFCPMCAKGDERHNIKICNKCQKLF